jgi:predicted flap endonuclease-1-like 5' DNA nuclease
MTHYLVELVVWTLVAYLVGCLIGHYLKDMLGVTDLAPATPVPQPVPKGPAPRAAPPPRAAETVQANSPAAPQSVAAVEAATAKSARAERPKGIAAARGGLADNLRLISGIGPKNERVLHNLGFFHFDQIAVWTAGEISWVDDHLKFNGRIEREKWVEQAKLLAAGDMEELKRQFGTGGRK